MKEAFDYMFKDNKFNQKALTYLAFAFVGGFLINLTHVNTKYVLAALVGALIMAVPCGYIVSCIKALIGQKENFVLPSLNIKNNFILGVKFWIATLILGLIFTISVVIASCMIGLISVVLNTKVIAAILVPLLILISSLFVAFYTIALNWIFATTESLTSFLQFEKAKELIKKNPSHYWKSFWVFIGANLLCSIIAAGAIILFGVSLIGVVLAALIVAAASTYVAFVNAFITAKAIEA